MPSVGERRLIIGPLPAPKRQRREERPAEFYMDLWERLPQDGPATTKKADNTEIDMMVIWKKWVRSVTQKLCQCVLYLADLFRYSETVKKDPEEFIKNASVQQLMAFFRWILDYFPRVSMQDSLHEYFRKFKMVYDRANGCWMDLRWVKSINSYFFNELYKQYGLKKSEKMQLVMSVDDLVDVLQYHWFRDRSTFSDERQRVQTATVLLYGAYTGQRPVSIMDARRIKKPPILQSRSVNSSLKVAYTDIGSRITGEEAVSREGSVQKVVEADDGYITDDWDDDGKARHYELPRGVLYRDIKMRILRSEVAGGRHPLVMEVTFRHTKGEDRKPQRKTFIMYEVNNLLLCPVAHTLGLALRDDAFAAKSMRTAKRILTAEPAAFKNNPRKKCVTLWWKEEMMNIPIFREPKRVDGHIRTSDTETLKASTLARRLKIIGEKLGYEKPLGFYSIRREVANRVDDVATTNELRQVMGHENHRTVQFYLNQRIKCDVQAAFLGMPSQQALLRTVGQMGLTADARAPTKLTNAQKEAIASDPKVKGLRLERDALSGRMKSASEEDREMLAKPKRDADNALKREIERLRAQTLSDARSQFFITRDTEDLDAQYLGVSSVDIPEHDDAEGPLTYHVEERAELVALLGEETGMFDAAHYLKHRITFVRTLALLCRRREARRRAPRSPSFAQHSKGFEEANEAKGSVKINQEVDGLDPTIPIECRPGQCIFCIGDESYSHTQKLFCWKHVPKMREHVEEDHLRYYADNQSIPCPHPSCTKDGLVLEHKNHFKNHVEEVHKIRLRDPTRGRAYPAS